MLICGISYISFKISYLFATFCFGFFGFYIIF